MNIRVESEVTMLDRLRDFDPDGSVARCAQEIFALMPDKGVAAADTFVDTYIARGRLEAALGAAGVASMREQALIYQREKYMNVGGEVWADIARACVRQARRRNIAPRVILAACVEASERVCDFIREAHGSDLDALRRHMTAIRQLDVIEAELICTVVAVDIAEEETVERRRSGDQFREQILSEVDGASQLGEGLREQAKDASAATRGMLGKASEVAAAAEQSALAMREAAQTSAGLIRAIEDARAEVESAAEVAARASAQAGDAVTMSSTLSDHAKSIESILGLIRDIAGQTNLLALNATIEAARAGDAGRGFAVVAQEVKTLASQTARATDDIAAKISTIQAATRQSVDTNERIRQTVDEVQSSADRIRTAMDAQAQTVTMITAAVDETALAADSMSSTISAIRQDTEVVASEIDELERGFMSVETKLNALRETSVEYSRRVV